MCFISIFSNSTNTEPERPLEVSSRLLLGRADRVAKKLSGQFNPKCTVPSPCCYVLGSLFIQLHLKVWPPSHFPNPPAPKLYWNNNGWIETMALCFTGLSPLSPFWFWAVFITLPTGHSANWIDPWWLWRILLWSQYLSPNPFHWRWYLLLSTWIWGLAMWFLWPKGYWPAWH